MVEVGLWWNEDEQIQNLMKKGEWKHLDPFPDKAQTGEGERGDVGECKTPVKCEQQCKHSEM